MNNERERNAGERGQHMKPKPKQRYIRRTVKAKRQAQSERRQEYLREVGRKEVG